jgi:S1-C subfamily serine protease
MFYRIALSAFLLSAAASAAPVVVVDDLELVRTLNDALEKFAEAKAGPTCDELFEAVGKAPEKLDLKVPKVLSPDNPDQSVYLIGAVNLCGKCDDWHPSGSATAWALSSDGLMVTNHHVFKKAKDGAMGVCGIDGKTHQIVELLAADEANDIAIFRVDSNELIPLPIGATATVGSKVEVISNPDGRFFTHTFGHVSRYHKRPRSPDDPGHTQMSITADYAKGSSGGPVLNENGEVVGMVSSTSSIYYKKGKGEKSQQLLQMVVKNCVPVSAISAMLAEEEEVTAE